MAFPSAPWFSVGFLSLGLLCTVAEGGGHLFEGLSLRVVFFFYPFGSSLVYVVFGVVCGSAKWYAMKL